EDGIRDKLVTGVQTCALPISAAALSAAGAGETHAAKPKIESLEAYRAGGGYGLLAECRGGRRKAEDLIALMEKAGLRGLGGAGRSEERRVGKSGGVGGGRGRQ